MIPPVSDNEDAYDKLITALQPQEGGTVLEIAILPSSHTREILYDKEHPALALPKSLLVQCYLIARKVFFGYLAAPESGQETKDEALKASSVVLLWDPNHNTAANFRKTHILSLSTQCAENAYISGRQDDGRKLRDAIQTELHLITSLQTSPLPKHPKSPTLWSHRCWLLQNFSHLCLPLNLEDASASIQENHVIDVDGAKLGMGMGIDGERVEKLWEYELGVVMRAGERHPRNYYAWGYARQLFQLVDGKIAECGGEERARVEWMWLEEGMGRVYAWCLMHPRDVSGWGFLVFLMQRVGEKASVGGSEGRYEVKRVVWETREWVRKYKWRGESVEWFLKAVDQLQLS
jgi:hypothetical protein